MNDTTKVAIEKLRKVILIALFLTFPHGTNAEVLIAAASSVRSPLESLVEKYNENADTIIKIVYGSSGSLAHQILRGAPFDLFLSADSEFPAKVWRTGLAHQEPVAYATGSLVIYAHNDSPCQGVSGLRTISESYIENPIRRIAIANPALAPYGKAAEQALKSAGAWEAISKKLVFGNSVAQVAQFGVTGAADCAIISFSQALTKILDESGSYQTISPDLYSPPIHKMVLMGNGNAQAAEFHSFLLSVSAKQVFVDYGFTSPTG